MKMNNVATISTLVDSIWLCVLHMAGYISRKSTSGHVAAPFDIDISSLLGAKALVNFNFQSLSKGIISFANWPDDHLNMCFTHK